MRNSLYLSFLTFAFGAHICQYKTMKDCELNNDGLCTVARGGEVIHGGLVFSSSPRACKNSDRYSYSLLGDRLCHETPQLIPQTDCPTYTYESCVYLGRTAYWARDKKAYEVRSCSPNVIMPKFNTLEFTVNVPDLSKSFTVSGDQLYSCNKLPIDHLGAALYGRADVVGYTIFPNNQCRVEGGSPVTMNLKQSGAIIAFKSVVETQSGLYYGFEEPNPRTCVVAYLNGKDKVFLKMEGNGVAQYSSSNCSPNTLTKRLDIKYLENDQYVLGKIMKPLNNDSMKIEIFGGVYAYQGCRAMGRKGSVWVPRANASVAEISVFPESTTCGLFKGILKGVSVISSEARPSNFRRSLYGLKFEDNQDCVTFNDRDFSRTFDQRGRLFVYEWDSSDRSCTMIRTVSEFNPTGEGEGWNNGVTAFVLPGPVGLADEDADDAPLSSDGLKKGIFDVAPFPEEEGFDGCGSVEVYFDTKNDIFRQIGCTTNECAMPPSNPTNAGLCSGLGAHSDGFWRIFDDNEKDGEEGGSCGGNGAQDGGMCWDDGEVVGI